MFPNLLPYPTLPFVPLTPASQPLITPRMSTSRQFSNALSSYSPARPLVWNLPSPSPCPLTEGRHIPRRIKPTEFHPPTAYPTPVFLSLSVDNARKYETCLTSARSSPQRLGNGVRSSATSNVSASGVVDDSRWLRAMRVCRTYPRCCA